MNSPRFFTLSEDVADSVFSQKEASIQCGLCPRRCLIAPGRAGLCKVRFNRDGKPALPFYGFLTALALDPIEKKPLYHFRPGTEILSIGFTGCNLRCPFCQNWHISQYTDVPGRIYSPSELIEAAAKTGARANQIAVGRSIAAMHSIAAMPCIAYTYSEPLVHFEFLLDCMKEVRKAGFANVLVTNGCINSEAAAEILELTDAANIDLKCFSEETYAKVLGGDLSTVLGFIKIATEKGVHTELTTLVVPGLNDSEEELNACVDFIADLENGGPTKMTIPWHLSAYHPDWKWNTPPTSPEFLARTAARAKERLSYVYTGNVAGEKNDTLCPYCGKILISRRGYRVDTSGLELREETYFCASCGKKAPIR